MRVGVNLRQLRPGKIGGLEGYVRSLVHWLPKLDSELELVLFGTEYNAATFTAGDRVQVLCLEAEDFANLDRARLREQGVDVWFCPLLTLEPLDPGVPSVVTIPDLQHEVYPEFFSSEVLAWRREAYRQTVEHADLILTLSDYSKRQIVESLGADPRCVSAIHLDASPIFSKPRQERSDTPAHPSLSGRYFLYPANPWPHKNHSVLFEALALLRRVEAEPPSLILTGADGYGEDSGDEISELHRRLGSMQSDLGVDDLVHHLGYVSQAELLRLYHGAQALVFPSLFEGFGLPLVEAMRAGCPVLASSATSLPEVGGEAALYFDPRDPEELSRQMGALLNGLGQGLERARLVERAMRHAERFSWRATAEQTLRELSRLVPAREAIELREGALPMISVVTPSFQQRPFLEATLRGVLEQDYANLELIVVDGGSTDGSVELLEKYQALYPRKLRFVSEPDRGQAHAVNKGLAMARGEIIGWLNSDDVYRRDCLAAVAEAFRQDPECDLLYGRADYLDREGQLLGAYPVRTEFSLQSLAHECYLCQPAVFWRRRLMGDHLRLDEELDYCMDYDLWIRFAQVARVRFVDRVLAGSRIYPENKTMSRRAGVFEEIFRTVKRHYHRVPSSWILGRAHFLAGGDVPFFRPQAVTRHSYLLATLLSLRHNGVFSRQWMTLLAKAIAGPDYRGAGWWRRTPSTVRDFLSRFVRGGRWRVDVCADSQAVRLRLEVARCPAKGRGEIVVLLGGRVIDRFEVCEIGTIARIVTLPSGSGHKRRTLRLRSDTLSTEGLRVVGCEDVSPPEGEPLTGRIP